MSVQCLKLADDLFPALIARRKTATIRLGKRSIDLGDLIFEAVEGKYPNEDVFVHKVRYAEFKDLTDADAQLGGVTSADELRADLRRFYPDIQSSSIVTIIEFR